MRTLHTTLTGLILATAACTGPGAAPEPPVLKVTSPQRSLVQSGAGAITVTGIAEPGITGAAVDKVMVNGVEATLGADGSFTAIVNVEAGATLLSTTAKAEDGGEALDTRAIHAGELRAVGTNVDRAVAASISTESFASISKAAGTFVKGMDIGAMLAPMQPMVKSGGGPDCLYVHGFIDGLTFSDIQISLVPQQGGIAFRAQIDGLDVPGHANYAVACADGSNNFRVKAQRIVVGGTLLVSPNGTAGFETDLVDQDVQITGLDIQASGIPGDIIDMLDLGTRIQGIVAMGAELAMEPMMNKAMGGLAGPKTFDVMGHSMTMEAAPADILFDQTGGLVVMDMKAMLAGAEGSKGFIYTDNGMPNLEAADGFAIGLADDLANQMMAQVHALGLLNMSMPKEGGTFDNADLSLSLPPMISADPADGAMRVVVGDIMATFTHKGAPMAKAAINVKMDIQIDPAGNGYNVALVLGQPEIKVNVVDEVENKTGFTDADLAKAVEAGLKAQIDGISKLLTNIPMPQVAGLQMRNLSVGSDDGYVMVRGKFE